MSRLELPAAALEWLVGEEHTTILLPQPARKLAGRLLLAGHQLICIDSELPRAQRLAANYLSPRLQQAIGRPDALPIQPCVAGVVLLTNPLRVAPPAKQLDRPAAFAQFSRALQPGGWVAGWQITRDDTVPWVRRLIRLMRTVDADAMSATSTDPNADLLASKYFPRVEQRDFRLWVPINRAGLTELVTSQPSVAALPEAECRRVLDEARTIFDNSASLGELRLPYQLRCWRAHVDHHELTTPITFGDGALIIPI